MGGSRFVSRDVLACMRACVLACSRVLPPLVLGMYIGAEGSGRVAASAGSAKRWRREGWRVGNEVDVQQCNLDGELDNTCVFFSW